MKSKQRRFTRRALMKSAVAAAPVWQAVRAAKNDELFRVFQQPPATARPFVRWWWNGDKLTEKEIVRELDLLHAAGIGGVEVNPIRFPNPDDPLNIPEIEWLSKPWIEMLQTAVQGARERGMIVDSIVGSGWPFGGQFLTREEQTHILALGTRRIGGSGTVRIPEADLLADAELTLHSKWKSIDKSIRYLRLVPEQMEEFTPGIDVTARLAGGVLTLDVPGGDHILYTLVQQRGFQAVINGAPGADGPVLNHFDSAAVEHYLDRMSSAIEPVMGPLGKSFRAMFCDSLELEGANWCSDMLPEFEARRSYSLLPYLPFVLFKTGEMGNPTANQNQATLGDAARDVIERVRYDFLTLQMELFAERFTRTYHQWCTRHGVKSRMQAYGPAYHPLESSLDVDIPECETWMNPQMGSPEHRAPTGINKFVASAARFSGKREVSCEELTNTEMVFNATLASLKTCADQSNLSGVTHSIFHGFNYSPAEAAFPGWVRYGTFFNERNPWWPFVKRFTDYKARLSALLGSCDPRTEVAVLHPFADLWMTKGMQREPFPVLHMPPYQYQLWEAIHQNGSGCDYVDEKLLGESKCVAARLAIRGRTYGAVIVMEARTVEPDTARALERFANGGGRIVFIRHAPSRSPRFQNREANDAGVQAAPSAFCGTIASGARWSTRLAKTFWRGTAASKGNSESSPTCASRAPTLTSARLHCGPANARSSFSRIPIRSARLRPISSFLPEAKRRGSGTRRQASARPTSLTPTKDASTCASSRPAHCCWSSNQAWINRRSGFRGPRKRTPLGLPGPGSSNCGMWTELTASAPWTP